MNLASTTTHIYVYVYKATWGGIPVACTKLARAISPHFYGVPVANSFTLYRLF